MQKKRFFILSTLIMVWLTGCAQPELPSNAITTQNAIGARYLDRIDFSYVPSRTHDFSQLCLCVAQNVSNNNVTLHDVSGSWVGPYTGNYYRNDNYQQIAGTAGIFKLVDEGNAMLIAVGTPSATKPGFPMPMTDMKSLWAYRAMKSSCSLPTSPAHGKPQGQPPTTAFSL